MNDVISRQAAIDEIKALYEWHDTVTEDRTIDHLKRLPSSQPELIEREAYIRGFEQGKTQGRLDTLSAQPEHTSNNDCNGCKFVGCYDTDFPCANCIRKNKDYYAPERRTDEHID